MRRSSLKSPTRGDRARFNARRFGAFGQCRERRVARGIGVARDVEPTQCRREQKRGKVVIDSAAAIGMAGSA